MRVRGEEGTKGESGRSLRTEHAWEGVIGGRREGRKGEGRGYTYYRTICGLYMMSILTTPT